MSDIAIHVENLSKLYHIGASQGQGAFRYKALRDTVADTLSAPARWLSAALGRADDESANSENTIWALKDISFDVRQGEVVGIIGRNGAGKSTLLKILSRITEPTGGVAQLHGRIGSLLEVGTGFHPELTGRENVYLNGAILGMKKAEITRKFDEIVAFAEIEKFLDTPVKHYSSGMYVRLAFAVAAHLEPEILMVDEVLAVGDAQFQKKCLGKMGDVAKEGRTVLFVSHNMGAIAQLCPISIWLEQGHLKDFGATRPIVSAYLRSTDASAMSGQVVFAEDPKKEAQLRQVRLLNQEKELTQRFSCDEPIIAELTFQIHRQTPGLYGYLNITKLDGTSILDSYSHDAVPNPLDGLPTGVYSIYITIPSRVLGHGEYHLYLSFARMDGRFMVDMPATVCTFVLDDFTTKSGNSRSGLLSTLLPWDISSIPKGRIT